VDSERERLRDLSALLLRLHKLLLDRERGAYETRHGATAPRELFRLLLEDREFAWLRALSTMIAEIDGLVDDPGPLPGDRVRRLLEDAYRLLKSGAGGEFQRKYHEALQGSADVVMVHAEISKLLPPPS
jgi:hypothetical protein